MPNLKNWFRRPRVFWIIAVVIVVVLGAGLITGLVTTQAAPPQPFPYSHNVHVSKGIQCIFCHAGATRGVSAGLPTKAKCQGCHNNINTDKPALKDWQQYASKHDQIEWVPVALMPDFVYFSHQPHVAAKLNCETCHGNVGQMTTAQPQPNFNMGWCLDCHRRLRPQEVVKLTDCATCHK
jgi:hypothetical protein